MSVPLKYVALAMSLAFAGAGVAAVAAPRAAATDTAKSTTKSKTETRKMMSDADFAKAAAEGGLAEVKLGQLASDKGSDKVIKDLGQRMVADHNSANNDLKTAATKDNIIVPTEIDQKDQATYDRLSKLSGTAFDRAYARDLVRDHRADIAMFRHEASYGKDAAIKDFAAKTLPTLESHLKEAQQTLQDISPKSSAKAGKQS